MHISKQAIAGILSLFYLGIAVAAEGPARSAASYPEKPIRIISPLAPGGSADAIARLTGEIIAASLGQPVVVDNRPGANGIIGIDIVAKAVPDGYTLLAVSSSPLTVNPALHGARMPYDTERDLAPITQVATQTYIAHASPAFAARSVRELIELAKNKPGTINYASAGTGSTAHLMAALFETLAGVRMTHVPYKGAAQGRTAVMSRECDVMFDGLLAALPLIKSGRLRGLGVTSAKRSAVAPDIPTLAEAGVPGYAGDAWYALLAPRGTPPAITAKLEATVVGALQTPAIQSKLAAQGVDPVGSSQQALRSFLRTEIVKWAKVVKAAGIKPE